MAIVVNPISPVAFSIFGFDVRWYALAYVAAFVVGAIFYKRLMNNPRSVIHLSKKQFDDLFTAVVLGVILGGRLGYVLFYNLPYFMSNPLEIFAVWNGGMSFHGGLLGVMVAVFFFAKYSMRQEKNDSKNMSRHDVNNSLKILDLMSVVGPIGLFFGRIANFINMELMGHATTRPWGVIFRGYEDLGARHASPLYEAMTEGVLLFILMYCIYRFTNLRKYPGALSGILGMGYAVARTACEFFRMPDAHIGFLTSWGLTMGQLLSGLMFIAGAALFTYSMRKKN